MENSLIVSEFSLLRLHHIEACENEEGEIEFFRTVKDYHDEAEVTYGPFTCFKQLMEGVVGF